MILARAYLDPPLTVVPFLRQVIGQLVVFYYLNLEHNLLLLHQFYKLYSGLIDSDKKGLWLACFCNHLFAFANTNGREDEPGWPLVMQHCGESTQVPVHLQSEPLWRPSRAMIKPGYVFFILSFVVCYLSLGNRTPTRTKWTTQLKTAQWDSVSISDDWYLKLEVPLRLYYTSALLNASCHLKCLVGTKCCISGITFRQIARYSTCSY